MGCNTSKETIESRRIDRQQVQAARQKEKTINLLLIGSGDSGKTTLRKQITHVHNEAFANPDFRKTFIGIIIDNLLDGTVTVLGQMGGADAQQKIEDLREEAQSKSCESGISARFAGLVNELQNSDELFIETLAKKRNELHIQECYLAFLQRLKTYPSWGGFDWIPSADECVRARTRTSGIVKETCTINGVDFNLIDVGGQRAERRKWLHVFEDVTAAIFVAALSDYDRVLFEDSSKNRLEEALDLFSECVNSQWLFDTPMLLFLNKLDVFQRKYVDEQIPLNYSGRFPSAPKTNDDVQAALRWVSGEFEARRTRHKKVLDSGKEVAAGDMYVHFTTATDPQNVKKVFKVSTDVILKENLKRAGLEGTANLS